jgi:hypothetical protein
VDVDVIHMNSWGAMLNLEQASVLLRSGKWSGTLERVQRHLSSGIDLLFELHIFSISHHHTSPFRSTM